MDDLVRKHRSLLAYKLATRKARARHAMEAKMSTSKLPQTAAGWVGLAVFVAIAALTAYQVSSGNWLAVSLGALGALGTALKSGVYPK